MADHKVTVSVVGKKVHCSPSEIHVHRGETIEFGPIAHTGSFRGRLKKQVLSAAQGAGFAEHAMKDEHLELGASPAHHPRWTHEGPVTIHPQAEFGAYAYVISVDTPEGRIDSDPVVIVEPKGPVGG
jgi:hypothetical protein